MNPTKLKPFREAYQKKLEVEEHGRWRNGLYVMRALNACFGGEYPEKPLSFGTAKESRERAEHDGYTQEEIDNAREALVMNLQIMEGRNQRAKAREERQRLREQSAQESDSE